MTTEPYASAGRPPGLYRSPVGAPAPRPRQAEPGVDLTRVSRWVLERGLDVLGEPVRFAADEQGRIVTVTLATVDHVVAWAARFEADRPVRLPADQHIGHPIVQAHIARDGWTIVFRCVEGEAG